MTKITPGRVKFLDNEIDEGYFARAHNGHVCLVSPKAKSGPEEEACGRIVFSTNDPDISILFQFQRKLNHRMLCIINEKMKFERALYDNFGIDISAGKWRSMMDGAISDLKNVRNALL